MLTVLGGLAEFERELIKVRTGEGRAKRAAKEGSSSKNVRTFCCNVPPSTESLGLDP